VTHTSDPAFWVLHVVRIRGLAASIDQVRGAARQWFTSRAVDSFHTVWFELHEDLLQTLAVPRATS
jgi:hypothetical protein